MYRLKQVVSVAASLFRSLSMTMRNRALMVLTCNVKAVPTLLADKPLVGTGMERYVARDSGVCVVATRGGVIDSVDASSSCGYVLLMMRWKQVKQGLIIL